jgi:WD40 repeat protein
LSIVDRDTGTRPLEIRVRIDSAYAVLAFSASGKQLACAGGPDGDPIVEVFDASSGAEITNFQPTGTRTRSVLFLPDGRLVVANGRNVYIVKDGEAQFALSGHKGQVNAVALAPDGRRLLTASHDGAIRTWDTNTGEPGPAFDWKIGPITALAFSPDGLTCSAAGLNGKIVVWDVDA